MSLSHVQERLQAAGFYPGPIDGKWGKLSDAALEEALARATARAPSPAIPPALTAQDYADAAKALDGDKAKLLAVKAVESGGGWFTDLRKEILDLDGPGGFIDGEALPKILFEAHLFSRETGGRFDKTHPNISSPVWNRALYIGGQAEYSRLHAAMLLDEDAALRSASWGMFQILGANHKAAGYASARAFVEAMKRGEREHLLAFVNFIKNTPGLLAKYRQIGASEAACAPFCAAYNGPGYATNGYHSKLALEFQRARRAT